jgi:hypothetical protein
MAHAKDRKFREVYVDRGQDGWGGMSLARKAALLAANFTPYDGEQAVDPTDQSAGIATAFNGTWASPYKPLSEAWYDAGPGVTIAKVGYSWRRGVRQRQSTRTPTGRGVSASRTTTRPHVSLGPANLRAAGPATLQTFTPATPTGTCSCSTFTAGRRRARTARGTRSTGASSRSTGRTA